MEFRIIKLIANAFLAQRISSINSMTALCEKTGANINDVALAIGLDKRIGERFLDAGPGFGGSCFKKDILNLVYICDHYGLSEVSKYWSNIIEINEWQQKRIAKIIVEKLFGTIANKKIGILGFSFKANTNDTRNSPAINICSELLEEGAKLFIYDPKVSFENIKIELEKTENITKKFNQDLEKDYVCCKSVEEVFNDTHAIVILTEWDEFRKLDFDKISKKMSKPSWIFDTRGIIKLKNINSPNLKIWSIGNGTNKEERNNPKNTSLDY